MNKFHMLVQMTVSLYMQNAKRTLEHNAIETENNNNPYWGYISIYSIHITFTVYTCAQYSGIIIHACAIETML